jgi:hypothetical protein
MRTTLDIDDDILQAAKELAQRERKTAGRILSELGRRRLAEAKNSSSNAPLQRRFFWAFVHLLAEVR